MKTGWKRQGWKYIINQSNLYHGLSSSFTVKCNFHYSVLLYWLIYFFYGEQYLKNKSEELNNKINEYALDYFMENIESPEREM